MSAAALQRVIVRMLFDPAFRDRVYADPAAALRDVALSAEERQWLVVPPPSAYATDAQRRGRALSSLVEEYPVASALALRQGTDLAGLQDFFASACFHQCVQQRGSMAEAFGDYLQAGHVARQPEIKWMAAIEQGIARVRRAPPSAAVDARTTSCRVCVAPWVVPLAVAPKTLARYDMLLRRLQQAPASLVETVLNLAYRLPNGPQLRAGASEWVLVVHTPGSPGPSLEPASSELGALLAAARQAVLWDDLCATAVRLGATPAEAVEILEDFLAQRLLVRVL